MAVFLAPVINDQQEDVNGNPLSGGQIEVYLAGTSTPATTYSDSAGLVPNTNPIVLNTLGVNEQGAVWLTGGSAYKFIVKNSVGVVQRTIDNVSGINDSAITTDQWLVYQAAPTFVSATSFTVAGDQTQTFQVGRRVRTINTGGTVFSTITGSVYSAPNTTVTVANDSGVLDSGLSQVAYGVISVLDTSLPGRVPNFGECRLTKSGANLLLSGYDGNRITINGSICTIPSAGITLAPTSLAPSTLYYIYAYMNGATLTLEASTTAYTTNSVTGVVTKTGDATRTLVGMARTIAGPAWSDLPAQRFVLSWFNRRNLQLLSVLSANQNVVNTNYVEIALALRVEFLRWASDETTYASFTGTCSNDTAHSVNSTILTLDGGLTGESYSVGQIYQIGAFIPVACTLGAASIAEGYHYFSPFAKQNVASTATYVGGGSANNRCVVSGFTFG